MAAADNADADGEAKTRPLVVSAILPDNPIELGISALAYLAEKSLLAVGRRNGSIDIYSTTRDRVCSIASHSLPKRWHSIVGMVWPSPARLLLVGEHGNLLDFDPWRRQIRRTLHLHGGSATCICSRESTVIIGTENGMVLVYRLENDEIEYVQRLQSRAGAPIFSVSISDELIAAGSRGTIWLWKRSDWRMLHELDVRAAVVANTTVHGVDFADPATLVSGDSTGTTCFWNIATGTLLNGLYSHRGAINCVRTMNFHSQPYVYSSGNEPNIVEFRRSKTAADDDLGFQPKEWLRTLRLKNLQQRPVQALCQAGDLVVAGGVDAQLTLSRKGFVMRVPPITNSWQFSLSTRLLGEADPQAFCHAGDRTELWRIGGARWRKGGSSVGPLRLLDYKVRRRCGPISASSMSGDGLWLAFADYSCLRIFKVNMSHQEEGANPELSFARVRLRGRLAERFAGAMALRFFENSDDVTTATLAVCDSEATLHLLALLPDRHDEDVLVGTLQWSATADALEATGEHGKSKPLKHDCAIRELHVSGSSNKIATLGIDGTLHVYEFEAASDEVATAAAAAVPDDDNSRASDSTGTSASKQIPRRLRLTAHWLRSGGGTDDEALTCVAFLPDADVLVGAHASRALSLIDLHSRRFVRLLQRRDYMSIARRAALMRRRRTQRKRIDSFSNSATVAVDMDADVDTADEFAEPDSVLCDASSCIRSVAASAGRIAWSSANCLYVWHISDRQRLLSILSSEDDDGGDAGNDSGVEKELTKSRRRRRGVKRTAASPPSAETQSSKAIKCGAESDSARSSTRSSLDDSDVDSIYARLGATVEVVDDYQSSGIPARVKE